MRAPKSSPGSLTTFDALLLGTLMLLARLWNRRGHVVSRRAVCVGRSQHPRVQRPRSPQHCRHTSDTCSWQLPTRLSDKSDALESDCVVHRNASSIQQINENIFGSLRSQDDTAAALELAETKSRSRGKPRDPAVSDSIERTATAILAKPPSPQSRQQASCLTTSLSPRPLQPETNSKLNLW